MWTRPARLRGLAWLASSVLNSRKSSCIISTDAGEVPLKGFCSLLQPTRSGRLSLVQNAEEQACNRTSPSEVPSTSGVPCLATGGLSPAARILRQMSMQRRHFNAAIGTEAPEISGSEGSSSGEAQLPVAEPGKKLRYPQQQNPASDPWTPTGDLRKRNFLPRRMGHLIQALEKEQEEAAQKRKRHPDFRAGDVLELKLAVPDNKGRPGSFKGICIARRNRGIRTSFTLRNHLGTAGGVERSFPLHCPTIQSITVLERRKVRRAKLYYLRDRNPKEYRVN